MASHDGLAEPDLSFAHARLKLARAQKHIDDLDVLCREFVRTHPQTIGIENDLNRCCARIEILPTRAVSPELALTAGDAVHNIRASLDFCWMGLVRACADPAMAGQVARRSFPFDKELASLCNTLTNASKHLPVQGLEELILDRIKPYEAGNSVLYSVSKLDNRDKHNLLILAAAVTHIRLICLTNNEMRNFGAPQIVRDCQVENGVPMTAFALGFDPGDPFELERTPDVAIEIMISEPAVLQSTPVVPHLAAVLREASMAVDLFQASFGGGVIMRIG